MSGTSWFDIATEEELRRIFRVRGVQTFYMKILSRNHNSKNQIYLAPDLSELTSIPIGEITEARGSSTKPKAGGPIFHAPVNWVWIDSATQSHAPNAQVIFYPQYPEVRLSGLLSGANFPPSELLSIEKRGYEDGRILFFGSDGETVFGSIVSNLSPAAKSMARFAVPGIHIVSLPVDSAVSRDSETALLTELARIHRRGWVDPIALLADGTTRPCTGPRCGGHTLEAHLGIPMNGLPLPDFGDWEVKSHSVRRFDRQGTGRITLFTPEPDRGAYSELGVSWFAENFGRRNDRGTRFDFTGIHSVSDAANSTTKLTLSLVGFDVQDKAIKENGMIALCDQNGELVSGWSFTKLLQHWQKKHALAAYVPVISRSEPTKAFSYGNIIHLARHSRFELFLGALASGEVVYDPGIKLELLANGKWRAKARSQFRIGFRSIGSLYESVDERDSTGY